jgi:hypothetical protein
MAGFLLQQFGTIPNVREHVDTHGWRFEIVDRDGRIDKVAGDTDSRYSAGAKAGMIENRLVRCPSSELRVKSA